MSLTKNKTNMKYETRRDFAGSSLTSSYQTWGSALSHAARIVKIINNTNKDLDISTDGTNDMDIAVTSTGAVTDVCAGRNMDEGAYFPAGTQFYVKASAAGTGTAYLVIMYTA